jgi:hypothetical protein
MHIDAHQVSESNAALAAKTSECEQWRDATFRAVQMAQHAVTSSQQAEDTLSSASTTPSGRSAGSPTLDRDEVVPALQLRLAAASAALSDTETRLEAVQVSATALRAELADAKAEALAMGRNSGGRSRGGAALCRGRASGGRGRITQDAEAESAHSSRTRLSSARLASHWTQSCAKQSPSATRCVPNGMRSLLESAPSRLPSPTRRCRRTILRRAV